IREAEERGAGKAEIAEILGRGRAKKGIFLGDLENGELEIGQNVSLFKECQPVAAIMQEIVESYNALAMRKHNPL
ncbi:MAG: nitronate monooxygenase, partial [Bacteroidales bacterium]|nr:nitronate monooxygenase [Bacteroidales bacterium]